MKIYIKDFIPKNIETSLNSINLIKKINEYKDIYSNDGLFRIQNDNVYQLTPNDIPIENFEYNNIDFILDKSKYDRKNVYCIPFNNKVYCIKQIEYKLDSKSQIILILEYHNDNINDMYFYTYENILNNILKDSIIEYLSLINNIKQS